MLLLPFRRCRTSAWQTSWSWVCFGLFVVFAFVLAGDVVYFGYVHRHAGPEVAAVDDALNEMQGSFLFYLLPIVAFAAAATGLGWGWRRFLKADPPALVHFGAQLAIAAAALILLYYGERGTLTGKRLRIVHAFHDQPEAAAHLSLNGPYSLLRSLTHGRAVKAEFYPWAEALQTAQKALFTPCEPLVHPEYPMLRRPDSTPTGKPNVVRNHARELGCVRGRRPSKGTGAARSDDALLRRDRRPGAALFPVLCERPAEHGRPGAMLVGFPTLPGRPTWAAASSRAR
jgi:hypothetical protein